MSKKCGERLPSGARQAIELYNQGAYYECHEALEDAWRAEIDEVRYLYQGILQIGVAFHHLGNNNWRGATGLLARGIDRVARFEPRCMGVNTGKLVAESRRCLELMHEIGPERIEEFDWSIVPRIEVSD